MEEYIPSIKIFTVIMGCLGLGIGLSLLTNAQGVVRLSRSLDKWVSIEKFAERVDKKVVDLDTWMLKNKNVAAVLFLLLSVLALGLGLFSR